MLTIHVAKAISSRIEYLTARHRSKIGRRSVGNAVPVSETSMMRAIHHQLS